jgi:hypothetical protein
MITFSTVGSDAIGYEPFSDIDTLPDGESSKGLLTLIISQVSAYPDDRHLLFEYSFDLK